VCKNCEFRCEITNFTHLIVKYYTPLLFFQHFIFEKRHTFAPQKELNFNHLLINNATKTTFVFGEGSYDAALRRALF
jgi:hypothetical protein